MDNFIYTVFGEGEKLLPWQMAARAFCIVIVLLMMLRVGGRRIFGKKNTLDNIMVIILGAVLARSIVGASPVWSAIAAVATMIALHRFLAWLALKSTRVNKLINGDKVLLFKDGTFMTENMKRSAISKNEILESLRLEIKEVDFENIESIFMETNGRISFVEKEKK
jgi:uncharacterized membrane protein YcaP (DUF421 family)